MGTRSKQRQKRELGERCAFVEDGCGNRPAYWMVGPFVVPERVTRANPEAKQARIPVVLAFVCADCMPKAMEWMPEAEITPVTEIPPSMVPMFMENVFGGQLPEVRFCA